MGRATDPLARDKAVNLDLPRMPIELADQGLCTRWPDPYLWTSADLAKRQAAARLCQHCTVLAACRTWALALPNRTGVVYGGLGPTTGKRRHAS